MDIRLALMCGIDIPVPELQVTLHQPTIKEIALIGEQDFFVAIQCLNVSKNSLQQDKLVLQNVNNFQIFMTLMTEKETKDKKDATKSLLTLMFPKYNILFTPRSIMLQGDNPITIDESNFETLQNICKQVFCINNKNNQEQGFNPGNEAARKIAEKLMRGRQRVAELSGQANASIFSQFLSSLTIGIPSMSLQDLMNLTMYQLYDLVERYQLYVSWDIDIKSRLAGAKGEDKFDNWMKNIH